MTQARRLAFAMAAAGLAVFAATLALIFVPLRQGVVNPYPSPLVVVSLAVFLVLTPILGALIAIRLPRNPAGWLFMVIALLLGFGFLSDAIARHLPPSPAVGLFASVASDVGSFWTCALTLLMVLFPNGRLPGPRWRVVPAVLIAGTIAQVTSGLFSPDGGIQPAIAGLTYPLARPDWQPALGVLDGAAQVLTAIGLLGGLALLAVRFRRSRGIERQQLKLFVLAFAANALVLTFALAINQVNGDWGNAAWAVFQGSLVLLPLAVAAAILRYRLFEIDVLIRRTLVYGILSAVLLGAYAASVLLLEQALAGVTATSSLAVAASTLIVAALFQPARIRIQALVDRRFYRARYDAALELAALRTRLRGDFDPQKLASAVAEAATRTMQPTSVSVWLREPARRSVTVPERSVARIEP